MPRATSGKPHAAAKPGGALRPPGGANARRAKTRLAKARRAAATVDASAASFHSWIANQQEAAPPRRKGERTRDRIRLATVELLNTVGYRQLKVADICARAGITQPVLYRYFENKQALTLDVLQEFLARFVAAPRDPAGTTPYGAIYDANLRWITLARANAGLMRCLLDASDDEPAFAAVFARETDRWNRRIADSVLRRFPSASTDRRAIEFVVTIIGGMVDELVRRLFATRSEDVRRLASAVAPDDPSLAHFISVLWHRALYGNDPPAGEGIPVAPNLVRAARLEANRKRGPGARSSR